ncbi:hypothetical protein GLOIN_2v1477757 [Rhizophagus irregularis DAOM 181602=DAOM 197198]|uniref:Uncharacterized protein n=1 Tax=Rhizophagus irregularis (strain DAOM 181602 / DAOM 197198 / MUCL 43194) TaxID=747089 RepID=A0A2P4Q3Z9_RHIID|nr:hypothetical protein GLOIN_2v1477757 [Rhizophagus irregularis DAOM 181602=DAOM 197198]POG72379.1 hypothetical protein GLOIN_2v1477757 [Rhizophagus irregularis DAOM 181602=DAOM 197198]|eukprot:XP_025179245.1 hypothetical protein GLOIN_2v1477757 [Rhizophagus irregularis DAOM 181602=DAOM 197198]
MDFINNNMKYKKFISTPLYSHTTWDQKKKGVIIKKVICCDYREELPDEKYSRTFEIEHDRTFEIKSCQTKSTTKLLELRVLIIKDTTRILKLSWETYFKNGQNCPEFFLRNGTVMQFRKISVYA